VDRSVDRCAVASVHGAISIAFGNARRGHRSSGLAFPPARRYARLQCAGDLHHPLAGRPASLGHACRRSPVPCQIESQGVNETKCNGYRPICWRVGDGGPGRPPRPCSRGGSSLRRSTAEAMLASLPRTTTTNCSWIGSNLNCSSTRY
jgi:hypothetical protein